MSMLPDMGRMNLPSTSSYLKKRGMNREIDLMERERLVNVAKNQMDYTSYLAAQRRVTASCSGFILLLRMCLGIW